MAINQKDYALIKTIIEFLDKVKKYIGIPRDTPLSLQSELEEGAVRQLIYKINVLTF